MKTIKIITDLLNMANNAANYAHRLVQLLRGDNKLPRLVYAPVRNSRPISIIKKFNQ